MFIIKLICALIEQVVITNPHKKGAWVYEGTEKLTFFNWVNEFQCKKADCRLILDGNLPFSSSFFTLFHSKVLEFA